MNSLLTLLETNPVLAFAFPILKAAVPMALLFSYTGLGFMVGALQVKGLRQGSSMYDKAARQLATLSLVVAWTLLVASRVWLFFQSDTYVPQSFLATVVELAWGIFGFSVIASSVHFAVWKPLASHKGLHAFLAFFSGVNGLLALVLILGVLRLVSATELPQAAELSLYDLFAVKGPLEPHVRAAAVALPLAFAMPALAALLWLVLRRNRDDYGRDYYRVMLGWCARWGCVAWSVTSLVVTATVVFDFMGPAFLADPTGAPLDPVECLKLVARLGLPSVVFALLFVVSRTSQPMRLKPWIILAFFLAWPTAYFVFGETTRFVFAAAATATGTVTAPIQ